MSSIETIVLDGLHVVRLRDDRTERTREDDPGVGGLLPGTHYVLRGVCTQCVVYGERGARRAPCATQCLLDLPIQRRRGLRV